ncbi:MAG: Yip1 family protein [archaeon]
MDFEEGKKYFKEGIEILKLGAKTMEKVAKDEKATYYAIAFFAIAGLAQAIGTFNLFGLVTLPIMEVVFSFVGVGIIHLLAKLFGGKAKFMELYRTNGIGYIAMWIAVIPFIGSTLAGLIGLWYIVVSVVILKAVHKLSTGKAVMVVLIPLIVAAIIAAIITFIGVVFLSSMFGSSIPGLPKF